MLFGSFNSLRLRHWLSLDTLRTPRWHGGLGLVQFMVVTSVVSEKILQKRLNYTVM